MYINLFSIVDFISQSIVGMGMFYFGMWWQRRIDRKKRESQPNHTERPPTEHHFDPNNPNW